MFAYIVASAFIGIFEISATTILECYLYDAEIAKHHSLDMKHVPAKLVKFLSDHTENTKVNEGSSLQQNLME